MLYLVSLYSSKWASVMYLTSHQRRRAQNRKSQRAFRERKDRHVKSLEAELSNLHMRYSTLLHNHELQSEEVVALRTRLAELMAMREQQSPAFELQFDEFPLGQQDTSDPNAFLFSQLPTLHPLITSNRSDQSSLDFSRNEFMNLDLGEFELPNGCLAELGHAKDMATMDIGPYLGESSNVGIDFSTNFELT